MADNYTNPVSQLLTYGKCDIKRTNELWPNYLELGFTKKHIPDLIRMSIDPDLNHADQASLDVWAPVHAWRTLGQLGAEKAVEPLIRLFDELENDDWLSIELPKVFSMIGSASLPALEKFLSDDGVNAINRISIPGCLERIAKDHPACWKDCVCVLNRQLERYEANAPILNGFLVSSLADLNAIESIDIIRTAYSKECVDISVLGDLEDAEIWMGIRKRRSTPPPRHSMFPDVPQLNLPNFDPDLKDVSALPVQRRVKVGRNDPCPCGSGKKFKKCCLH